MDGGGIDQEGELREASVRLDAEFSFRRLLGQPQSVVQVPVRGPYLERAQLGKVVRELPAGPWSQPSGGDVVLPGTFCFPGGGPRGLAQPRPEECGLRARGKDSARSRGRPRCEGFNGKQMVSSVRAEKCSLDLTSRRLAEAVWLGGQVGCRFWIAVEDTMCM